jgi:hypothetical protein
VEGRTRWCDFRQAPFDGGVNVLVVLEEHKCVRIQLAFDPAQTPFDGGQLLCGQKAGGGEPAGMREAARDVIRIELEIDLER